MLWRNICASAPSKGRRAARSRRCDARRPPASSVGDGNGEDSADLVPPCSSIRRRSSGVPRHGRRVVNEHPVVRIDQARRRDDSVQHAVATARSAAVDGQAGCRRRSSRACETRVPRREHHEHDFHLGRGEQPLDRVIQLGLPASGEYCLSTSLPKREPDPAAGTRRNIARSSIKSLYKDGIRGNRHV